LEKALKQLRQPTKDIRLWVDAICIYQQDEVEKVHQVSIMRDIYSGAEDVLIWLGPSSLHKDTRLAFCL
jgi:hypothetical protein